MGVQQLDRIFKPRRIALFGANENPASVGCTVLRNLVGAGFRGAVYPIHPTLEAVLGVPCHTDPGALTRTPDLAVICTPAADVPRIVDLCGAAGILGVVIISAGFGEAGEDGKRLEAELLAAKRRHPGMRIVGPNCLGVVVPGLSLNASFAAASPKAGHIAFISQSGALGTAVLDWALEQGIGFSYFVSVGNMLDVDFGDLIDYFGEDETTRSVILYIESLPNARKFMTASRAFARTKPIVAYKAGRFAQSARAAASHTGAMAGEDAVYDAAFQRAGIARVFEIGEIFSCAELIARYQPPRDDRLAIVTNAGGPGVMATDALIARKGRLAELSAATLAKLDEVLPPMWSRGNPVDVLGDARPKRVAKAVDAVLDDPGVDAVLVILTPQAMTNPTGTAKAIGELTKRTTKPVLAAWLGGGSMREGTAILSQAGIATYATPEAGVRAFMTLVAYARNLETLYETPRDIRVELPADRGALRRRFAAQFAAGGAVLDEVVSKSMLEAYGIDVARPVPAATAAEAVAAATRLGFPVALKILSPDITHKTDVGGVALDRGDADAVAGAFVRITSAARLGSPDARIDGVTVQRMIPTSGRFELILGTRKDPTFGPVILVGTGGIAAEVFGDRALGFPPLNERLARRMVESLASWPLLRGYRGRAGVDVDRLIETMIRFSYLVADHPEIAEFDVNPLLVGPGGAVALDARAVVDRALVGREIEPFSHLVLRPYPEEYVRPATLRDGSPIRLRPIRPEDEPLWKAMLGACSSDTIFARFRGTVAWFRHDMAVRYCFIDYDREIAIVAEQEDKGERRLLGVGRLIADPDHDTVEFAVLVADPWQNQGLGGVLTEYCVQIAERRGHRRVVAETSPDNVRMIALFERLGFTVDRDSAPDTVLVAKTVAAAAPAAAAQPSPPPSMPAATSG